MQATFHGQGSNQTDPPMWQKTSTKKRPEKNPTDRTTFNHLIRDVEKPEIEEGKKKKAIVFVGPRLLSQGVSQKRERKR